jgi:polysaccharide biosynthesis transport protein
MTRPQSHLPMPVEIQRQHGMGVLETEPDAPQIGRLVRKYLLVFVGLFSLGVLCGCVALILDTPVYKARLLLEVNPINESYVRTSLDPLSGNMDPNGINVSTQIRLLQSGPAATRVWQEMVHETAPPPVAPDNLAKLRTRIHRDPHPEINQLRSVGMAVATFDARPVAGTRLIELSSESIHPLVAAEFLNRVAQGFVDESDRDHSQSSELTSEWLNRQLNETKAKLEEAEARLRTFVERYGSDFLIEGSTLHDAELKQLQSQLATAHADLLSKQARYEAAQEGKLDTLPEIMDDPELRDLAHKLAEDQEKESTLGRVLTPNHYKMQQLAAEEQLLTDAQKARRDLIVERWRTEFNNAASKEKLLNDAYSEKGGKAVAEIALVNQYTALKRDEATLQSTYDALSQRINQSGGPSSTLPVGLIRLVEKCTPPSAPYKPQPTTTMALGGLGGIALAAIVVFLREKSDKSIRTPGAARGILNLPELGVIPEADRLVPAIPTVASPLLGGIHSGLLPTGRRNVRRTWTADRSAMERGVAVMVESFRFTLASLMREVNRTQAKVIMVTSAEPGDGKTTIVANLGVALAESGKRVVVVDADLRKPHIHQIFDVGDARGLKEILQETRFLDEYPFSELVAPTNAKDLFVIQSGEFFGNVAPLLYSPRLGLLIKRLRMEFDFVLLDVSPVTILADARVIGRHVDGAALVIRSGHTSRQLAIAAARSLSEDGIPLLGTILNHWTPDKAFRQYYESYPVDAKL